MSKKKLLALLLSVILCFSLAVPALATEEEPPMLIMAKEDPITILYTNDVHTYIDGDLRYSTVAAFKESLGDNVLLVDAGDHIQGTAYGSMDKGKTIIDLMNAAGYDLATLGNHEFDYGMDGAMNVIEWAEFPYVSANFYHEENGVVGETVLDAYKVFEAAGKKIAFIGITTPESFTKSTPAYFQNENGEYIYGIGGGTDGSALYTMVQEAIDAASAEADIVIALGHLGDDPASMPWTSEELIANTCGLDAFIDGHSHSTVEGKAVMDKDGHEVWLTQTGEYLGAVGQMTILADGTIATRLVAAEELAELTPDADVKAIEDTWITEIDTKLGEVIGSIDDTLDNYAVDGTRLVRSQETNTGDFAADALYYLFDNMGLDVDFAIMNGGGVRNKAITGEISYKTCKEIHTFGNVACLQTITGQQMLDALEWGARDAGNAECGGFLQVSGLKYTIDTTIPSTVQKDEKGVWTGAPTGEYRVKDVQVLNNETGVYEALDLNAKYNLAGYNYTLRDLGDGYAMFEGAVNVLDYVMEDYMVLANYVQSFVGGKVTGYAQPQGRIQVLPEVTILYTNDIHTYIDNTTELDAMHTVQSLRYSDIARLKECFENVLLVDAGDHIQGTAYGSMDNGKTIIDLMNAAGYDLATLGNHEFDYGMDGAMDVIEWADFPYVSANFYHEENGVAGETVLDAYKIFYVGGLKIAFIGITTPESFTKSTPAYFQNENGEYIYGIGGGADGSELYTMVQAVIDEVSEKADVVIALGHLGIDAASSPWTSEELIANTTGLDAFIDGHSHSVVEGKMVEDKEGNKVLLTQTGEYLNAIGKMTISASGVITTELLDAEDLCNASKYPVLHDYEVEEIEKAWITEIDAKLGEVIGSIDDTLDNYDANGERLVRMQETNTGDFVTDALYYLFDNMGLDVDFAMMNGGGIRNKAITGDISYFTCKDIHTFGNVACLQTITGQQMLDALEWGARGVGLAEVGGFLHVSGLKYTVDTNIESTVQQDEKGVWIGGPTGEYRVKDVQVLNKETGAYEPLDLNATYNLAGYNYTLRDLGDGYAMFDGAVNVLDYVMTDYMVLANYVQSFENGKVTGYAEPQGRITIIKSEQAESNKITVGGLENNLWTTKYGNLYCDCKAETFINELGFNWGDLVTVKFLDQELVLPVVPTYSYVDSGKPAIIVEMTDTGAPTSYVSFAINMGNFTGTYGIATKQTDEEGNWWWTANEGVTFPMEITFELYEQGGYMAEYILHELNRTNERADYAHLTDNAFANFRAVATTGMGENVLFRSSSPINPELGRNTYADAAIEAAGVKTIVNLADSAEDAASYEGFADSYYAGQNVAYLCLGVDFQAADFQSGLANGLRHMAENKGPYLVHCTEGKDRAGFVNALLECLMGATYEEVVADYMTTYYNYYGIEVGTEKYTAIAESNIIKSLKQAFGVEDLASADLKAEAAEYMKAIGLTDAEIAQLTANLGGASNSVTYTVIVGDTLWKIAKAQLGSGAKWNAIYEANKDAIKNPNLIFVGQELVIPGK